MNIATFGSQKFNPSIICCQHYIYVWNLIFINFSWIRASVPLTYLLIKFIFTIIAGQKIVCHYGTYIVTKNFLQLLNWNSCFIYYLIDL